MDGSTKKKDRKKALSAEPDDENPIPDVLVVQIQTACEGLNLQHFNEVYFTTPHWNPAVEDQSIARAHRIGQTSPVNVYKFITTFSTDATSLDQYCLNVQQIKRDAASIIKPTKA